MRNVPSDQSAREPSRSGAGRAGALPSGIARLRFDSSSLPMAERFDRWRAAVGNIYELSAPGHDGAGELQVKTSIWNMGSLLLSDNRFGSRFQRRTTRSIRSDQVDHYRLLLQTGGRLNIDADGRRETLSAGRLILTDLARPETYATGTGSNIVLFVPRAMLDGALPRPLDLHGIALAGASAALLSEHMRSLVNQTSLLTASELPALNQATVSLLAASIAASSRTLAEARPAMEFTVLRQACRYIDSHLTEPGLSVEQLCGVFKVSRTTLYRLFEPHGGISRYIKERRLLRVHAVLASSTRPQRLGRLADDYGFKTATHFSRAFREQFGYSPSEAHQVVRDSPIERPWEASYDGFDRWLRAIRDEPIARA